MLVKFSKDGDPHLVSLLATYEQSQYFYLIFPWAEANLRDYWEVKNPNPSLDKRTVHWVIEQCKGIVKGVLKIHRYQSTCQELADANHAGNFRFGHHGDIKPENILWFPDTQKTQTGSSRFQHGTLKLADFGLAAINPNRTASRNVVDFSLSRPYCPPEADLPNSGGPGRQYDMWTLGCLYLEFITWLVGGWKLVSKFECSRLTLDQSPRFFDIKTPTFFQTEEGPSGKVAMIKPQVTKVGERPSFMTSDRTSYIPHPSNPESFCFPLPVNSTKSIFFYPPSIHMEIFMVLEKSQYPSLHQVPIVNQQPQTPNKLTKKHSSSTTCMPIRIVPSSYTSFWTSCSRSCSSSRKRAAES